MASLLHSAEGSTWKKRNHKYLYKEGNRYIYPEDVNKSKQNSQHPHDPKNFPKIKSRKPYSMLGKGTIRLTTGDGHYKDINVDRTPNEYRNAYKTVQYSTAYTNDKQRKNPHQGNVNMYGIPLSGEYTKNIAERKELNRQKAMVDEKRQHKIKQENAINKQGTSDYKKLSEQHANREAARNGKVVNPTYTLRDDKGNKVARLQSKDKVQMPTVADYKKFSQLTSGAKNRKKMVDKQGSVNYKKLSRDHADQAKEAREPNRMGEDYARKKAMGKLVRKGVDMFGNEYTGRGGKAYDVITNSREGRKRYDRASGERLSPDIVNARKNAVNKQGSSYDWRRANTVDDAKSWSKEQQESKGYEIRRSEKNNKKELKKASNRLKKLTNKGYFTVQNGKTIFVPADESTTKKVSKGRKIINNLKNKFSKKK